MIVFTILSSLLLAAAVVLLFGLTPDRITDDFMRLIAPKQSLRDKVKIARGKKKSRKLAAELNHIRDAMIATGKGAKFSAVCALSMILLVSGAAFALMIDNLFLIPVLGTALSLIPFLYAKSTISYYDRHVEEEMETALSIISTSYIRSDDIVSAVRENISYLKPPVRDIFKSFVGEATAISSNLKTALENLKRKADNEIFAEWCDTLITCQDDRTLKDTLLPVVNKLTDIRIVNSELKTILYSVRNEYFTMAALVVGNIPLLYMLNRDWYNTLMHSLPGKFTVALCGLTILVTAKLLFKYTRPLKYKR